MQFLSSPFFVFTRTIRFRSVPVASYKCRSLLQIPLQLLIALEEL